jgi:hypothetical protein
MPAGATHEIRSTAHRLKNPTPGFGIVISPAAIRFPQPFFTSLVGANSFHIRLRKT